VATAWAQTPEGAGGPPQIYNIGFLVMLVGIFYFLLLRPEQKRRKEHTELLAGLKRNDQVVLNSGIHGRVVTLGDTVLGVEIAPKIQVQVDRNAVQSVERASAGEPREKEREKS
jgi:preprotein translocase subunit YajC